MRGHLFVLAVALVPTEIEAAPGSFAKPQHAPTRQLPDERGLCLSPRNLNADPGELRWRTRGRASDELDWETEP